MLLIFSERMPNMLDNATDIKIVAIRNDIASLKDQYYIDHPEYVALLNTAYNALDDLVYLKIMKEPRWIVLLPVL